VIGCWRGQSGLDRVQRPNACHAWPQVSTRVWRYLRAGRPLCLRCSYCPSAKMYFCCVETTRCCVWRCRFAQNESDRLQALPRPCSLFGAPDFAHPARDGTAAPNDMHCHAHRQGAVNRARRRPWAREPARSCRRHTRDLGLPVAGMIAMVPRPSAVASMRRARHTCLRSRVAIRNQPVQPSPVTRVHMRGKSCRIAADRPICGDVAGLCQ
jgi:hypothetical protein